MLGALSVIWLSVIAAIVVAQRVLPANAANDLPLALPTVGLEILVTRAPFGGPRTHAIDVRRHLW